MHGTFNEGGYNVLRELHSSCSGDPAKVMKPLYKSKAVRRNHPVGFVNLHIRHDEAFGKWVVCEVVRRF